MIYHFNRVINWIEENLILSNEICLWIIIISNECISLIFLTTIIHLVVVVVVAVAVASIRISVLTQCLMIDWWLKLSIYISIIYIH